MTFLKRFTIGLVLFFFLGTAKATDFIWVDDALPPGSQPSTSGEPWIWISNSPIPLSGTKAHHSPLNTGNHTHYFLNATPSPALRVGTGDKLFAYIFIDALYPPREIMLQWHNGSSWSSRAYWGENLINIGIDGTASRHYAGPIPALSKWVRLEVPANLLGLEGKTVGGMAFTLSGGRASWDKIGRFSTNRPPAVSITAPLANAKFIMPNAVAITATAADPDINDAVKQVAFFDNGNLIGIDTRAPYNIAWNPSVTGVHKLSATAIDTNGVQTTSASVAVTVYAPTSSSTIPNYFSSSPVITNYKSVTCASPAADWMTSQIGIVAPIKPSDCANVEQSPPDFIWPDLGDGAIYDFTLRYPSGVSKTARVSHNWINWTELLPAGLYSWQVTVTLPGKSPQVSNSRKFTVAANAIPFLVPSSAALYQKASTLPRPRAFPRGMELIEISSAIENERAEHFKELLSQVNTRLNYALPTEPVSIAGFTDPVTKATVEGEVHNLVYEQEIALLEAAFAWKITGEQKYLDETRRRASNLASWDPRGATSFSVHDRACRSIAWALSLAYDWLYPAWSASEQNLLLSSIIARQTDMFNDVVGQRGRIGFMPYDAHGVQTLSIVSAISSILAGTTPDSQKWVAQAIPLHVNLIEPWGGEDGGFANGTAYAHWTIAERQLAEDTLRWSTGLDVRSKAFIRNYGNFISYFLPPGTPTGMFGDAAERPLQENWARYGKGYAYRNPGPLSLWYAKQLSGEDRGKVELLLAPRDISTATGIPLNTPNAAILPYIGWAAMHSNLADANRTSVYFKSSSFGSYNHSHADQNSFVIHANGKNMAIDSGYYDYYNSAHWTNWTKQTVAHNAITFDGGIGQLIKSKSATGDITNFIHRSDYDMATGNATLAYGGALTKAIRTLVYFKPDLLVVFDSLSSEQPRTWEWNIHSLSQMEVTNNQQITLRNGSTSLCVETRASQPIQFSQTNQFPVAPAEANLDNQWHGAFSTTVKSSAITFMSIIRVNCAVNPSATVSTVSENEATLFVGARRVSFDGVNTLVQ